MSNAPKVRFAGFTGDWEQRKLGDMGTTFTGLSGKTKNDFGHGDARFVTYMNVFTNPVSDPDRVEAVEIDKSQNAIQYGDVFFTTSSETPEEVGMSSVWLENTDNIYLNSFCFGYRPTEKIDPHYMAYMLRSETVRKNIIYLAQGISRYNISKNGVMQIEVPVPNINEQRLVGEYFSNLDNLITLHQREYDKLVSLKSACLDKMFPKNGSKVPELRFAGFTSDWEQRKVGDLLQTIPFKTYLKEPEQDGKYEIIQQGYDPIIGYANGTPCDDYKDTVIFGDHTLSLYKPQKPFFVATDGVRIVKGIDDMKGYYLLPLLERYKPQLEGYKRYFSILADRDAFFTADHEEQTQVGSFFANLDDLVTLHQRKLEKLKQLKQSVLYSMFA